MKMGIKEGTRAFYLNAPADAMEAIAPPSLAVASELTGEFDYIHFFAGSQADLGENFLRLKPRGML